MDEAFKIGIKHSDNLIGEASNNYNKLSDIILQNKKIETTALISPENIQGHYKNLALQYKSKS